MRCSRFVALVMAFMISMNYKESPQDFNDFLKNCTSIERIQLLQALKDLPELKDEYFGTLKGLPALNRFTNDKDKASPSHPFKPSTFVQGR